MRLPLTALLFGGVVVSFVSFVSFPSVAHAAPATDASADTGFDDPKLARRLRSRTTVAGPIASPPTVTATVTPPVTATPAAAKAHALAPAVAPAPVVITASTPAAPMSNATPDAGVSAIGSPAPETSPAPSRHESLKTPRIGLGYRRFSFVQLGAIDAASTSGAAASEAFNSLSLDFYPVSGSIRFGLSTQYGWQDGRFDSGNGDYFIAQSASLGIQRPGPRLTPFAEAFAGGGYMRRYQFDRTVPTAYWQFGIDAGASVFLADHGFISLALGYLRPVNGFLKEQSFTSVYVDTWSLKLGFGL